MLFKLSFSILLRRTEFNTFSEWLDSARRELEDRERSISDLSRLSHQAEPLKEFVSDVIAHQADLRFISMAAQKLVDETNVRFYVFRICLVLFIGNVSKTIVNKKK